MANKGERAYWGFRTFCLITGASRGIGQEIALQFANKFKQGSLMVLLARTESGLEKTKSMIESSVPGIHVKIAPIDLTEPDNDQYFNIIANALMEYKVTASDFEHSMVVHNAAGAPGNTERSRPSSLLMVKLDDLVTIEGFMKFNVYGAMLLTVQFLKAFPKEAVKKRSVVQISSIACKIYLPQSGLYCMSKAARNMYFQSLAKEDATLDVLSYGPGPVDTEMLKAVDKRLGSGLYDRMKATGKVLTCEKTVKRLVDILADGHYRSGEFVDYYTDKANEDLVNEIYQFDN